MNKTTWTFFGVAFLPGIVDWLLALVWWPPYFRGGLVIYRKSVRLPTNYDGLPRVEDVQRALLAPWGHDIHFRRLSDTEIAFRESLRRGGIGSYTPVMHIFPESFPEEQDVTVMVYSGDVADHMLTFGLHEIERVQSWSGIPDDEPTSPDE